MKTQSVLLRLGGTALCLRILMRHRASPFAQRFLALLGAHLHFFTGCHKGRMSQYMHVVTHWMMASGTKCAVQGMQPDGGGSIFTDGRKCVLQGSNICTRSESCSTYIHLLATNCAWLGGEWEYHLHTMYRP